MKQTWLSVEPITFRPVAGGWRHHDRVAHRPVDHRHRTDPAPRVMIRGCALAAALAMMFVVPAAGQQQAARLPFDD